MIFFQTGDKRKEKSLLSFFWNREQDANNRKLTNFTSLIMVK